MVSPDLSSGKLWRCKSRKIDRREIPSQPLVKSALIGEYLEERKLLCETLLNVQDLLYLTSGELAGFDLKRNPTLRRCHNGAYDTAETIAALRQGKDF